jgi:hypothetical protein
MRREKTSITNDSDGAIGTTAQIGSTPNVVRWVSMNRTITWLGGRAPPREKCRRQLQDLVRAPQLSIFALEVLQPLSLIGRQPPGRRRASRSARVAGNWKVAKRRLP